MNAKTTLSKTGRHADASSALFGRKAFFWGGGAVLLALFLWLFQNMLTPFILGIAVAYLLDPVVEKLVQWKWPRLLASLFILFFFVGGALILIAVLVPLVYREAQQFISTLPEIIERLRGWLSPYSSWLYERIDPEMEQNIESTLKDNLGKAVEVSGGLLSRIIAGGQALIGLATTLVVTPIVAFFMMKDWPQIKAWIHSLIPPRSSDTVVDLWRRIDLKVSGFVRGQLTVAFILGLIYALALTLAGLDYGFLIGLTAGFLSIIPLLGSSLGLVASVAVAWFQSGEFIFVGIIATIFVVGQFVEGNILTPKILGKSVNMHALWILFAIMAGASVMGIAGMLLAVPVAATIGVLLGYALERYKDSDVYHEGEATEKAAKKTAKARNG